MSLDVGSRIGDYEIVSVLGAGGMGKVFKVRNTITDRVEAMKVLLPDLEHEPELADRFMREIKVQASLQHPNIAALHTALRVENQLLMIMELVEGITLDQRLRLGPVPVANGVDYIYQVLSALGYAHEHGVIHRDIKPANMMLTPNGVVKLMDFGIAKAATDHKLTVTGTTMGSIYYMSPEQIKGLATVDARSDLYSVGVSFYEIVTGKKPFDGDSQFAIMAAHLEKTPVSPITLDGSLPQVLNDVILMSIAKDPDQRFQSAKAFNGALGSVRQSVGAPVGPAASTAALTVSMRPHPAPPVMQAAPVMQQGSPAIQAASEEPPNSSKRWLWASAGALATVFMLVAAIQFGPWRKSSAHEGPRLVPDSSPASTSATITPPPPVTAPAAGAQTERSPDAQAVPPVTTPTTPVRQADTTAAANHGAKTPARQTAQQLAPPRQISAPAVSQPVTPVTQTLVATEQSNPAMRAADPVALQQLRARLALLAPRVRAVRTTMQNLKRAQAENGMSMRKDMAAAESRMNYMLDGANSALGSHDSTASKKFIDSAEGEVEKLEKFLGL